MKHSLEWHQTVYGNSASPPVVFLHGFLGRGKDWGSVAEALSDGFYCVCPDLPGHGDTLIEDLAAPPVFPAAAESLAAWIDEMGLKRPALAGYSMGGRLALYCACQWPERFSRVVIESASPGLKTDEERQARLEQDEALAVQLDAARDQALFRAFLEAWYAQPLFSSLAKKPALLDDLISRRIDNRSEQLAAALRALGTGAQPGLWDALPGYRLPTLAIAGAMDRKYCQIAEEMSDSCPRIAVHVMADCGHNVHFENPGGYTTVIRSFLEAGI
jgi:2-succinyl-6-hydroxy-2,4-cyclohexadiene-1-carboxylate synthase